MAAIVITMFALGLVVGFIGAGGSGFVVSILTTVFGFSIHLASGTALAAMVLTTSAGAVSHLRERNVKAGIGLVMGCLGAVGALITSRLAVRLPTAELRVLTAAILFLAAALLLVRLRLVQRTEEATPERPKWRRGVYSALIGLGVGGLSGMFGIGAAPFIQLGLLAVLGLPERQAAGTTMLVIIPTALAGAIGYDQAGFLDLRLLVEVVGGTAMGSYLGAKFTRRLPRRYLKAAMVIVPAIAGGILLS